MSPVTQLLQNAAAGTVLILVTALLRLALKKRLPPEVWLVLWAICLFRLLTPIVPESPLSVYALPWRAVAAAVTAPAVPAPAVPAPAVPAPSVSVPSVSVPSVSVPAPAPPSVTGGAAALPEGIPSSPIPDSAGNAPVQTAPAGPAPDLGAVLRTALAAIWLLGAAVTALRFILSWRRTRRAVRSAPLLPPSDPRYAALPPGVRLREGPVEGAPLTFGAVRPTVVLPPNLSGAALVCVLAHEGVHARRRDNLWHYAVALARTAFWWDPAVWLMERLLRRDIELSCDRAALDRLGPARRREYAMTILDLSIQGEGAPFSRAFGQKQAEERIIAIMKYKKITALALVLSVLLVCVVTAAFATEPVDGIDDPASADTEPVETEPVETEPVEAGTSSSSSTVPDTEPGSVSAHEGIPEGVLQVIVNCHGNDIIIEAFSTLSRLTNVAQSDLVPLAVDTCLHLNYDNITQHTCYKISDTQHRRITTVSKFCYDCNNVIPQPDKEVNITESHSFGPSSYVGADHSSPNYSQHCYIYEHTCPICTGDVTYTVPAACTKSGCVNFNSVTPEPEVNSTEPVEPDGTVGE